MFSLTPIIYDWESRLFLIEMKMYVHMKSCASTLTVVLFMVAPSRTTQCPTADEQTDRQGLSIQWRIIQPEKERSTERHCSTGPCKHYTKWKKPVTQGTTLAYDSISPFTYIKCPARLRNPIGTGGGKWLPRAARLRGNEEWLLTGLWFSFWGWWNALKLTVARIAQLRAYANPQNYLL